MTGVQTCALPICWGHNLAGTKLNLASQRPGVNLNELLDENLRDPLTGNAVLSGVVVTLTALIAVDEVAEATVS